MGTQVKMVDSEGRIKGKTQDTKGRTTGSKDINGTLDYGYDDNDRLTSLKVEGETSSTFDYDNNGARTAFKQPNLVNTSYGYDAADQLLSWFNESAPAGDYTADAWPWASTPAWTKYGSGGESVSGGILTTNCLTGSDQIYYELSDPALSNTLGTTLELKLKVDSSTGDFDWLRNVLEDGTRKLELVVYKDGVRLYYNENDYQYYPMNTIDDYHVYRLVLKGQSYELQIDGTPRISGGNLSYTSTIKRMIFGVPDSHMGLQKTYWDYVKYWRRAPTVYTYDASGNRTKADSKTFTYNTSTSQIKTMVDGTRTTTFTHNAAGNLTSASSASDATTYAWMGDNRLASVSSSSTEAAFTYDAEGKRTSKTINGTTTKFVYDDIKLIAEKDSSGNITARYFYDDSGKLISMKKNGQSYYFHLNQRGDVISITNSAQAVVASYSYDPWGNILSSSGSFKDEQPFRYASYFWDEEIGMYYLINRYYDPVIGRFISKDPAGDPESAGSPAEMNPYVYAGNNPVMATDPDGLRLLYYSSPPMRGEDVRWVQMQLIAAAFGRLLAPYGADGVFGSLARTAVIAFQRTVGVTDDGVVGPQTTAKLVAIGGPYPPAGTGNWTPPAQTVQANNQQQRTGQSEIYRVPGITNSFFRLLKANAGIARKHRYRGNKNTARSSIKWYKSMVGLRQPWDIKWAWGPEEPYMFKDELVNGDDLGNIHYGYQGAAMAFAKPLLLTAATFYNVKKNGPLSALGDWPVGFDGPRDHSMVKWGFDIYHDDFKAYNQYLRIPDVRDWFS